MKLLDILRGSETFCQLEWRYLKTRSLWAEYERRESRRQSLLPMLCFCIAPATEQELLMAAKQMAGNYPDDIGMIYQYLESRSYRGTYPLDDIVKKFSYRTDK